jgi:hypothetical protein
MESGNCPICQNEYQRMIRYPRSVCVNCLMDHKVTDYDGNIVKFENEDVFGGFKSIHYDSFDADKIIVKQDHNCFINGFRCYADEGRFGGIVIQTIQSFN